MVSNRHLNLIEEGVDLALRAGKLEDSTLVARKIATSHLGLYASPSYLKRRPEPKTFAEVAEHDVVIFRGKQGKGRIKLQGPNGLRERRRAGADLREPLARQRRHAGFAVGSSFRTKLSITSRPTPITIAVSAMLNAGQYACSNQCASRKSTTKPRARRSM